MIGTITKIHPLKTSRNKNSFMRVEFQMADGTWAKTDLCPNFRNFARWRPIVKMGAGVTLKGLDMNPKRKNEVNADSFPTVTITPVKKQDQPKPAVQQLPLL